MGNLDLKLAVGFITYGDSTAKYLPYFLPSLEKAVQNLKSRTGVSVVKILAFDNTEVENNENKSFLLKNYPTVSFFWAGKNLGFAKANNVMIRQAINSGMEYFLALNPDMIFDPEIIVELIKVILEDKKIGAIMPKILRWDFGKINNGNEAIDESKTNVIDSRGLFITKNHRFSDMAQGEIDDVNDTAVSEIFGFTGAAVLFRLKALEDVAYNNGQVMEYFDELMFMYKEDCDLSYRLRLGGWKILLASAAVAYHNRAASGMSKNNIGIALNRKNKSRLLKQWSFLNQWILLLKFKNLPFSFSIKFATVWYQFKCIIFILLFERFLLAELTKLWRIKDKISRRRDQLKIRVKINEIEHFMEKNN